jgi:hypothetical protein
VKLVVVTFWVRTSLQSETCQNLLILISTNPGFRIDPHERLEGVYRELVSLYSLFCEKPVFGVNYEPKNFVMSITGKKLSLNLNNFNFRDNQNQMTLKLTTQKNWRTTATK